MRCFAVAALAAGLLPAAVLGAAGWLDLCPVDSVLKFFACERRIPNGCVDNLTKQATAWCSSYLSIQPVTVYLSTTTPVSTKTVIETLTTTATTTDVIITRIEATSIETATVVDEETVTATVTAAAGVAKRIVSTPWHGGFAPATRLKLSRACGCLNPPTTTVTIAVSTASASTTTSTETTVVTVVVPETSFLTQLTTVVTTQPVTVTSTATATATVQPPTPARCTVKYPPRGFVQPNSQESVSDVASAEQCCELSGAKPNCVATIFSEYAGVSSCRHLVNSNPQAGAVITDQCPLGVEQFGAFIGAPSADGLVMLGPCAA